MRIYIVSVDEFNERYHPDCSIEEFYKMTEVEIQVLNSKSFDRLCKQGPYTMEEFVNQFNYADDPITSDKHYIKTFND